MSSVDVYFGVFRVLDGWLQVNVPDAPPNFGGAPGADKVTSAIGVIKAYGLWTALGLLIVAGGIAGVSHMGGFGGGQSKAMSMAGGACLGAALISVAAAFINFFGG